MASIPDLRRQLLLYVNKRFARTTQTALCDGRHTLHQRVARWLCWAVEGKGEAEELCLTHDQLARNLGVRRATVSEILADLETQKVLKRGRGPVLIYPERAGTGRVRLPAHPAQDAGPDRRKRANAPSRLSRALRPMGIELLLLTGLALAILAQASGFGAPMALTGGRRGLFGRPR